MCSPSALAPSTVKRSLLSPCFSRAIRKMRCPLPGRARAIRSRNCRAQGAQKVSQAASPRLTVQQPPACWLPASRRQDSPPSGLAVTPQPCREHWRAPGERLQALQPPRQQAHELQWAWLSSCCAPDALECALRQARAWPSCYCAAQERPHPVRLHCLPQRAS